MEVLEADLGAGGVVRGRRAGEKSSSRAERQSLL